MNAAINAVHATMPNAIQDELDPIVKRGFSELAAEVLEELKEGERI